MKNKYWKLILKLFLYIIISLLAAMLITGVFAYAYYKIFDDAIVRTQVNWIAGLAEHFFLKMPGYMIITLIIAVVLLWLLTKRTTKRMNAVLSAVSQMRNEDYRVLLPNDNNDALGEIEQGINVLAGNIHNGFYEHEKIEQAKDEFILNIAHDLRTPLTSIIGYLTFIGEKQLDPEICVKYAAIALDKSKQLESLIESFSDIGHFSMDAIQLSKEDVNLKKFLLQKQDELFPQLNEADMELRIDVPASIPTLWVDGRLMARVFDNLISNAIRYAKEGKYIDVTVEILDEGICISFITHANPVPIADLERIFDKLYRVEKSRSTQTGGIGLGLAISRRLVELHDGTLIARQTADGTAFDIKLPK